VIDVGHSSAACLSRATTEPGRVRVGGEVAQTVRNYAGYAGLPGT